MRALILLICILAASIGAQARTLLETHQKLNIGSGYGRPADLSPPSPSSSPPTKEVSSTVSSGTTTSENSELLIMSTSSNELLSFKKLFVSYLLPVSYVWNHLVTTTPSFNHDEGFEYKLSFDEKHWRPRAKSPPSPKPSDHHGETIINSKFDDENNNNSKYGRPGGKGKLSPPAPQYDPPIHQVTSNGERSLSNQFLAST